jgi:hypothetical protein
VISVRFCGDVELSGSVCFAAYSAILRQWYLCANAKEEEIEAPALWWCSDPNVASNESGEDYSQIIPQQQMRRSNKVRQLELFSLPNIRPNS